MRVLEDQYVRSTEEGTIYQYSFVGIDETVLVLERRNIAGAPTLSFIDDVVVGDAKSMIRAIEQYSALRFE